MRTSPSLDSVAECSSVVWERGDVACVVVIHSREPFYEIRLMVNGRLAVMATFTGYEAAARHAIEQLHTYSAN
jgi:hypothetical protein